MIMTIKNFYIKTHLIVALTHFQFMLYTLMEDTLGHQAHQQRQIYQIIIIIKLFDLFILF